MERLPRPFRRPGPVAVLVIGLVAALLPAFISDASADDLKDKQDQVKKGIKRAAVALDESSAAASRAVRRLAAAKAELDQAQRSLAAAEGRLTAARTLDQQMQRRLTAAKVRLDRAERALVAGQEAVVEQRADIGRLAAEHFQYGDPKLMGLSMVLNSQDPRELTTQLNTVDALMERESAALARLRASEAMLLVRKDEIDAARAEVARQRRAAAAHLTKMTDLEKQVRQVRDQVAGLVTQRQQAAAAARRARAKDLKQLRALEREEQRIRQMIIERARQQRGGYRGTTDGLLQRPVPGYLTSPFGYRTHPIYGYWGLHNGADFRAPCGSSLRAAAAGTVISAYYSQVWGNRLIIDIGRVNGSPMTLIYNHLQSFAVGPHARVTRGQVVGTSGNTGWSTGCHLHFTVLQNGNPVDPVPFF